MINFLDHPERFALPSMSPVSGLTMSDREAFLFELAMRYLRHDRQRASSCAVAVLSKLRLALVDVQDFASLGLPELDANTDAAALLVLAKASRHYSGNLYASDLPRSLWAPRPRSVKHSYWTSVRKGTLRYRCTKKDSAEEVARIRSYKARKVVMERGGDVRIRAIQVSLGHLDGEEVVDGLALEWDDGTVDTAGGMEGRMQPGSKRVKVPLDRFQGVQPQVVDGKFVKDIKFVSPEAAAASTTQDVNDGSRCYGPFRSGGERGRFEGATGSCKDLSGRCFLDGVKGVVVKVAEGGIQRPAFTALHFKMSLLADAPLVKGEETEEETGPALNAGSVECERILTRTALRKALAATGSQ